MTDRNNNNGPEDKVQDGNIKASIWRNTGEERDFFSVSVARTYKDEQGNYRDTNSFIGADLLKLSRVAEKAYDRTEELRREDFKERRKEQDRAPSRTRSDYSR
ncbi:MAG: hypothetical protein ACPGOY_11560 [Rhodospirillaceae bacterium]